MSATLCRAVAARAATACAAAVVACDGCPVQHDKKPKPSGGGCPLHFGKNDKNNMPATPAQERAPGQKEDLSTARIASTIPQAQGDKRWEYPSPQMFWNALVRKGKVGGATEGDMDTVVAVHNAMNEQTWLRVLDWEKLRDGPDPTLVRFTGRPTELSPKARLKQLLGHVAPFDRHDWVVARGDDERRYVIDYYSDESQTASDETPKTMHDHGATKSIVVDVRPAFDGVGAAFDRVVAMPLARVRGEAPPAVPLLPTAGTASAPAETDEHLNVKAAAQVVGSKCSERFQAMVACGDDAKRCADAAIALQHCVASVVCPDAAETFRSAAIRADKDPDAANEAYAAMNAALDEFQKDVKRSGARCFD